MTTGSNISHKITHHSLHLWSLSTHVLNYLATDFYVQANPLALTLGPANATDVRNRYMHRHSA